ncbi:Zinc/iron permease [Sphaerosporella brunnea]|uniref:Zinc/iron permease n=1 Tax=Sphaerosporella brunnea TaxID=1250544 RepID=A0A5J5F0A9_9PEZI|nr:Zinc/iron permease [Sphaerosporella brunnea]KAA8908241.1 Zinc/iron permease [Sphaerosporella brunnea]
MNCPTRDPEPTGNPGFNQNPPSFDRALVPRSSPVCGGRGLSEDEYNLGLHVMGLFVIFGQSTLACAFPLIAKKYPFLRIPPSFLFFARHFGTGVLIATAFVHLLPTAFISLSDDCLPEFWTKEYPAMPGAIAMAAVFLVAVVEMVFTKGLCSGHYTGHEIHDTSLENGRLSEKEGGEDAGEAEAEGEAQEDRGPHRTSNVDNIGGEGGMGSLGFGMLGRRRSRTHSVGQALQRLNGGISQGRGNLGSIAQTIADGSPHTSGTSTPVKGLPPSSQPNNNNNNAAASIVQFPKIQLTPQQKHKKAILQCFLLELGILFHSIFIGMAVSVTVGSAFVVLLIAIVFHQTFEGLALGSRIAALDWKKGAWQPWLMACAYGLTTPIGQAIGLATHTLYSPDSQTGLLVVGIMNAISSGLLVFAGLVELLAEDFLSDESWHTLSGRRRIIACCWVFFGAFGMALVGAWA